MKRDICFIGLDVGTSGLKGLLVDEEGRVIKEAESSYPIYHPEPGWSEQNPEDWWEAACKVLRMLSNESSYAIRGIGLSGQMHGSVFLDGWGQPLYPAILWNDQRTVKECEQIVETTDGRIEEWTCNPPRTAFTLSKILWFRNHKYELYQRVAKVVLPKDYLRYRLSGAFVTDVTDASGTSLLNVRKRIWSEETLRAFEIPGEWLCDLVESPEICAQVSADVARETGVSEGTYIVGGAADQAAAALGNGVCSPGVLSITLGTSGVVYVQTDGLVVDPSGALHSFCHSIPGTFQLMGGVLCAAGSLEWFRKAIGQKEEGFPELLALASQVPRGSEGLIFLPYLTGERSPYNDPLARGAWFGLTVRHGKPHLIRALLEGVGFALYDLVNCVYGLKVPVNRIHVAGGGAKGDIWTRILSEIIGEKLFLATVKDSSAFGAAMLAASGVLGVPVKELCTRWVKTDQSVSPEEGAHETYLRWYEVFTRMYSGTCGFMHQLSRLEGREG